MLKYLHFTFIFILFSQISALAQTGTGSYFEVYSYEQKDSCSIELSLRDGAYQKIHFILKTPEQKTLTDEEIVQGIEKAWPENIEWELDIIEKKLLWKEAVVDGINRKTPRENLVVRDKLKIFFLGSNGNKFRSILDLFLKITPIDSGKAADISFVAVRNSTKLAKNLHKEKFADETVKQDPCYILNSTLKGEADVTAELWGKATLTKK